jgi:hypothetical protein
MILGNSEYRIYHTLLCESATALSLGSDAKASRLVWPCGPYISVKVRLHVRCTTHPRSMNISILVHDLRPWLITDNSISQMQEEHDAVTMIRP